MKVASLLKPIGMLVACASGIAGILSFVLISRLGEHSLWFLDSFYGSGKKPEVAYGDLYRYAEEITRHRNHLAFTLGIALCVVTFVLGVVLLLWSSSLAQNEKKG
jgi:hypothetical protein